MTRPTKPLPAWAVPGAEVVIREPYSWGGGAAHTRTTVTRTTATSIFVKGHNGEYRFVAAKYGDFPEEYGTHTGYRRGRALYPADHPTIAHDQRLQEANTAQGAVRKAIKEWEYRPSDPDRTAALIEALQDYKTKQEATQ